MVNSRLRLLFPAIGLFLVFQKVGEQASQKPISIAGNILRIFSSFRLLQYWYLHPLIPIAEKPPEGVFRLLFAMKLCKMVGWEWVDG